MSIVDQSQDRKIRIQIYARQLVGQAMKNMQSTGHERNPVHHINNAVQDWVKNQKHPGQKFIDDVLLELNALGFKV